MKSIKANVINIEALIWKKSMMNLKAFQMKSLCINSYKVLQKDDEITEMTIKALIKVLKAFQM